MCLGSGREKTSHISKQRLQEGGFLHVTRPDPRGKQSEDGTEAPSGTYTHLTLAETLELPLFPPWLVKVKKHVSPLAYFARLAPLISC